jgi:hypothetical protein
MALNCLDQCICAYSDPAVDHLISNFLDINQPTIANQKLC